MKNQSNESPIDDRLIASSQLLEWAETTKTLLLKAKAGEICSNTHLGDPGSG